MRAISSWQTRANALTAMRLLAAPLLAASLWAGEPGHALALYAFAVATDVADGWVARRYREATALGGFLDHAVDATFVTTGCLALALQGVLPVPLPLLIAAAFLQYALDSRVSATRPLRGSTLGRWNGIAYYVVLAVPIVRDALGLGWPRPDLLLALGWGLVGTTLLSMIDRLRSGSRRGAPRA